MPKKENDEIDEFTLQGRGHPTIEFVADFGGRGFTLRIVWILVVKFF